MLSSRTSFLIGLAVSAALHAALYKTAERYAGGLDNGAQGKPPRTTPNQKAKPTDLLIVPLPKKDDFGEKDGAGDAINSSEGEQPQMALQSRRDQAALTRDPTGNGPVAPPKPPQPLAQATTPPPAALPVPPSGPSSSPPPSKFPAFQKPTPPAPQATPSAKPVSPSPPAAPSPPSPAEPSKVEPPRPQPSPRPLPQPPAQQPADATPPRPPGGTPAPQTDQDSDLFAKEVAVEFKRGRVSARPGRQFKFHRPRTSIAQMVEGVEISFPAVIKFRLTITPEGKIRRAEITKSTGSPSIDRAFLLAMYESWMEPKRDASGKPIGDQTDFTMTIE